MDSNKKRILITGGSGLLALNWALAMRNKYSIILGLHDRQVAINNVTSLSINLTSYDHICNVIDNVKPDFVIHTAGITNVEDCESNPDLAKKVNTNLAANVAEATKKKIVQLVHISTDHLFDGTLPSVSEENPFKPLNVYGFTKAQAEIDVLNLNPEALVVRTNFFGWGPSYRPSFSDMIINNLRAGYKINLFNDVFYTPISAHELISSIHQLIDKKASGVYHVVGDDRISKYEFGLAIAKEFELDATLIIPSSIKRNLNLVKRPLDMSLCNSKARTLLQRNLGTIEQQIKGLKIQESSEISKDITNL